MAPFAMFEQEHQERLLRNAVNPGRCATHNEREFGDVHPDILDAFQPSAVPTRIAPADRTTIDDLTDAIYRDVFDRLDAEPMLPGDIAGFIATQASKLACRLLERYHEIPA
jgi:hypothetical protein